MRKAIKISGGHAVKRKARVEHYCYDCDRLIEQGEEYYQLNLKHNYNYITTSYYTKPICRQCWKGGELKA